VSFNESANLPTQTNSFTWETLRSEGPEASSPAREDGESHV